MNKTTLIETRKPTTEEKNKGAEIVFIRQDKNGNKHIIYGRRLCESWEQWGAITEILFDNMENIEQWRNPYRNIA